MRSVVDRNIFMRRISVLANLKGIVQPRQNGRWASETSVTVSIFCDRQWPICGGDHDTQGEYPWCVAGKFVPFSPQKGALYKQNHDGARKVVFVIQVYVRRDRAIFLSLLEQALNFIRAVKREIASVSSYLSNRLDRSLMSLRVERVKIQLIRHGYIVLMDPLCAAGCSPSQLFNKATLYYLVLGQLPS